MKPFKIVMLTCCSLIVVAAIVGFIDYRSATRKGRLVGLYNDKDYGSNTHFVNKQITAEDYSRKAIGSEEIYAATTDSAAPAKIAEIPAKQKQELKSSAQKKKKNATRTKPSLKEEEFSYKSFSRAPLPRKAREAEILSDTLEVENHQ